MAGRGKGEDRGGKPRDARRDRGYPGVTGKEERLP